MMIVTVTLNPMLDKTVEIGPLRRGEIHRASGVGSVVGGKGVNVARQLERFGVPACATGLLGGEVGLQLVRLLSAEGLRHDFLRVAGMTREGVTYREPDNTWTAIFEPPHQVTAEEAEKMVLHCSSLLGGASWVVCSGSSPCGETDGVYARIVAEAREKGCRSYCDSYGDAFRQALRSRPTVVQCNRAELAATLGRSIATEEEIRDALKGMIDSGIEMAVVTDGSRPAYAAARGRIWKIVPPAVEAVNPTGSGDCFAAGVLRDLEKGRLFEVALKFGAAAGAANAQRWDVATVSESEAEALVPAVSIL